MIILKRKRYLETNNIDWLSIENYQNFYINLPSLDLDTAELHCSCLLLDKKILANKTIAIKFKLKTMANIL